MTSYELDLQMTLKSLFLISCVLQIKYLRTSKKWTKRFFTEMFWGVFYTSEQCPGQDVFEIVNFTILGWVIISDFLVLFKN